MNVIVLPFLCCCLQCMMFEQVLKSLEVLLVFQVFFSVEQVCFSHAPRYHIIRFGNVVVVTDVYIYDGHF
jgi:hypothetical protein